ncbi:hypothetical protein QR680_010533 [Steinernema hermaphroditum]|uniref:Uncharacterized protein n=1 Tax=Steinernema hermaphroditum TaxID=289476 RepID=A0AA39MBE9_9BILA|nr:hypothetical protein QR680_010533 [Steinernema hermaphroditum]
MVSFEQQPSHTLPRTRKPSRSQQRPIDERPSTSAENEGYLIVTPNDQKARFIKAKRTRTKSEMRTTSASYTDLPEQDAPPPPLTPRTTSAGELSHYSTLPRIAEIGETPASPVVLNGSYFIPSKAAEPSVHSYSLPPGASLEKKGHKKTHSYHNSEDFVRPDNPLQYADVAHSETTGMRWMNKQKNQWYIDQPVEPLEDAPGPSNRTLPLRPHSTASSFGRVSFTFPPTPQKESMEADPLLITDLPSNADGEVHIQLPQRNPSFRRNSFRHRVKHFGLVHFFVVADRTDYTLLTVITLLMALEAYFMYFIFHDGIPTFL